MLVQPQADDKHLGSGAAVSGDGRKRGAASELEADSLRSLELAIVNLGNPHPNLTVAEEVVQVAEQLNQELERTADSDRLISCLVAVALEMPPKMKLLFQVLRSLARPTIKVLVERVLTLITKALQGEGPWRHVSQALCWLAMASQEGLISVPEWKTVAEKIVKQALTLVNPHTAHFMLWTVGAAFVATLTMPLESSVLEDVLRYLKDSHYVPADVMDVWRIVQGLDKEAHSASINGEYSLLESFKLPDNLVVDESWDGEYRHLTLFEDTFPSTVEMATRWFVFYAGRVLIESMELNHRRCADALLYGLPLLLSSSNSINDQVSGEKMTCELLLGQLLRENNSLLPVVYEMLLIDCCRQASRTFPPIMARAINCLFKEHLHEVSSDAVDRLAVWFAHHLCNFELKWNWGSWEEVFTAPDSPINVAQRRFLALLIAQLSALTYAERVQSALPPAYHSLIPHPRPVRPANGVDFERVDELVKAISERRLSPDEIDTTAGHKELLVALLEVGSKSLSHALAVLERYHPIWLRIAGAIDDEMLAIVDEFWQSSSLHWQYWGERLVNYRIVKAVQLLSYCLERQQANPNVARYLSRPFIFNILQQSARMASYAEKKLQASGATAEKIETTINDLTRAHEECINHIVKLIVARIQENDHQQPEWKNLLHGIIFCYSQHSILDLLRGTLDDATIHHLEYQLQQ